MEELIKMVHEITERIMVCERMISSGESFFMHQDGIGKIEIQEDEAVSFLTQEKNILLTQLFNIIEQIKADLINKDIKIQI